MDKNDLVKPKDIIIGLAVVVAIGGLTAFLFFSQKSTVTDEYNIMYHPYRVAMIYAMSEDPDIPEHYLRRILYGGDTLTSNELTLKNNETIYLSQFINRVATNYTSHVFWRDLYRNGESIRVIYLNVTETPFSLIRRRLRYTWWSRYYFVTTDALKDVNLPQRVEVYYLSDLHRMRRRIDGLSDDYFDALREDAMPLWNGVIRLAE